ncbi:MAG: hypothetical protein WCI73_06325, partial [Phycisphaerae bacterium]
MRATAWMMMLVILMALGSVSGAARGEEYAWEPLKVVGVLGNTGGMGQPVPYAYYTGIAADGRGRLYLAGASQGVGV